jgi:cytochrome c oxidase cbb3-type subunit 4
MTTGDLQSLITLITFLTFVGIVGWAYSSRRRQAFSEAASIPLDDDIPLAADARSAQGNAGEAGQENQKELR